MCAYINLHLVCQDVEYHRLFLFCSWERERQPGRSIV